MSSHNLRIENLETVIELICQNSYIVCVFADICYISVLRLSSIEYGLEKQLAK